MRSTLCNGEKKQQEGRVSSLQEMRAPLRDPLSEDESRSRKKTITGLERAA
jgi:hypothetical protein